MSGEKLPVPKSGAFPASTIPSKPKDMCWNMLQSLALMASYCEEICCRI